MWAVLDGIWTISEPWWRHIIIQKKISVVPAGIWTRDLLRKSPSSNPLSHRGSMYPNKTLPIFFSWLWNGFEYFCGNYVHLIIFCGNYTRIIFMVWRELQIWMYISFMWISDPDVTSMPIWEKIIVFFIISISISSLYAVAYTYIRSQPRTEEPVKVMSGTLW